MAKEDEDIQKVNRVVADCVRLYNLQGDMAEEALEVGYLAAVENNYDEASIVRAVNAWRGREIRWRRKHITGIDLDNYGG
jgi:hypothetical protein